MGITSNGFIVFVLGAAVLYYLLPKKIRWMELLTVSLTYYAFGGVRYLIYLLFSIGVTYLGALGLEKTSGKQKKGLLALTLTVNIGMLGVVKYTGFFLEILQQIFGKSMPCFSVLLPLGISFYVFQTSGYLIDVYRGTIKREKNLAKYALFVSFFPQIIQGPIGRWERLSPQLFCGNRLSWEHIREGVMRMVWGFFKTMVIADWAAVFVDAVFAEPDAYQGLALVAVLLYSLQLYANFSGGIDVVLGTAQLFGIHLDENFRQPYFAVSIGDFWRRWHMSLSAWLKDYVYIPLGGSHRGKGRTYCNLILTFFISGIWHGADWTFVVWGLLHGLYQVIGKATKGGREALYERLRLPGFLRQAGAVVITFFLVSFAWIFFRADNLGKAFAIIGNLLCPPDVAQLWKIPAGRNGLMGTPMALAALAAGTGVLLLHSFYEEWAQRIGKTLFLPGPIRFLIFMLLLMAIGAFGSTALARGFIYAQF